MRIGNTGWAQTGLNEVEKQSSVTKKVDLLHVRNYPWHTFTTG